MSDEILLVYNDTHIHKYPGSDYDAGCDLVVAIARRESRDLAGNLKFNVRVITLPQPEKHNDWWLTLWSTTTPYPIYDKSGSGQLLIGTGQRISLGVNVHYIKPGRQYRTYENVEGASTWKPVSMALWTAIPNVGFSWTTNDNVSVAQRTLKPKYGRYECLTVRETTPDPPKGGAIIARLLDVRNPGGQQAYCFISTLNRTSWTIRLDVIDQQSLSLAQNSDKVYWQPYAIGNWTTGGPATPIRSNNTVFVFYQSHDNNTLCYTSFTLREDGLPEGIANAKETTIAETRGMVNSTSSPVILDGKLYVFWQDKDNHLSYAYATVNDTGSAFDSGWTATTETDVNFPGGVYSGVNATLVPKSFAGSRDTIEVPEVS